MVGLVRIAVHTECAHHRVKYIPMAMTALCLKTARLHTPLVDEFIGHPDQERNDFLDIWGDGPRGSMQVQAILTQGFAMIRHIDQQRRSILKFLEYPNGLGNEIVSIQNRVVVGVDQLFLGTLPQFDRSADRLEEFKIARVFRGVGGAMTTTLGKDHKNLLTERSPDPLVGPASSTSS